MAVPEILCLHKLYCIEMRKSKVVIHDRPRFYTMSDDRCLCAVAVDFLEQMKILQQLDSASDSESELSLSLGIISRGSFILPTNVSMNVMPSSHRTNADKTRLSCLA